MREDAAVTISDPAPPTDPETLDASRRTHLAAERTLLAWWRSGLAAMAVALAVGRLLPALLKTSTTPFAALGVGFGALALALVLYGTVRQRHVDKSADRRRVPSPRWVGRALAHGPDGDPRDRDDRPDAGCELKRGQ